MFPVSFGQEQCLAAAIAADRPVPNLYIGYDIQGELDVAALIAALRRLVHRHDALRVTIHLGEDGGPPRHAVLPEPADQDLVTLQQVMADSPADFAGYAEDVANDAMAAGWPGAYGYPFRFLLLRADRTRYALIMVVSHLVFDGRSITVFTAELDRLYRHGCTGRGLPDLPPARSHLAAAARERARFQARADGANTAYWQHRLAPSPRMRALAVRQAASAGQSAELTGRFDLTGAELAALRRRCAAARCSPFQALLRAYGSAAAGVLDADRLVVFTPHDTRTPADRDVVGMFVTSVPLVLDRDADGGIALDTVRRELLRGTYHAHVPARTWARCRSVLLDKTGLDLGRCLSATHVEHDRDWPRDHPADGSPLRRTSLPDAGYTSRMLDLLVNSFPDRIGVRVSANGSAFTAAEVATLVDGIRDALALPS
jgi:hypothetical protein